VVLVNSKFDPTNFQLETLAAFEAWRLYFPVRRQRRSCSLRCHSRRSPRRLDYQPRE